MALVCLALINAGFLVVGWWFDLARPLFNIDYALVLLLITLGWRWVGGLLAVISLLGDTLVLVSQVLPFPRVSDLLYLLSFAPLVSAVHAVFLALALGLIVTKLVAFIWIGQRVTVKPALLVLNLLLLVLLYQVYVGDRQSTATYRHAAGGVVASQAVNFVLMRSDLFLEHYSGEGLELKARLPGATELWFDAVGKELVAPRLLLVLVESWGTPHDPAIQQALLAPLHRLPLQQWQQGTLNTVGTTLDGELRELCMLHSSRYNLTEITEGFENCLPNRLQQLGYETAAVHGATGMMYDRHHWYPRVGFQRQLFFESQPWPRRCFSFPGACDRDMAEAVKAFFSGEGRRFMYWLTLNSHAPYDLRDLHRPDVLDCQALMVSLESEVCRNLLLQAQFFADLAELLRSDSMAGMDVVVVSDHVPIIMNAAERQQYFVDGVIPWVRLVTKVADDMVGEG